MQTPKSLDEYLQLRTKAEEQSRLVVVKYTADWCSVCKSVQPILDKLAVEFPEVCFISYDVESFENAETDDIQALPTFKIFNGSTVVKAFSGNNVNNIRLAIEQFAK